MQPTIKTESCARTAINESRPIPLPVPVGVLSAMGAPELRKLARLATPSLPGLFASNGDRSVLVSVLSGETVAADWALDGASGSWVRSNAPAAPAPAAPAPAAPAPAAPAPAAPAPAAPAPAAPAASGDLLGALGAMLTQAAADAAKKATRDEVARILDTHEFAPPIAITLPDGTTKKLPAGNHHKALPEILTLISADIRNVFLVGPSGSGKSTLGRSIADALSQPYSFNSCSAGMSETVLMGRVRPLAQDPDNEYQSTNFVTSFVEGGVYLLDEMDAADANLLVSLNEALASGKLSVPSIGKMFDRHPSMVFVGAANTYGTGPDRQYVGRGALDAATLDRFSCAIVEVDYDPILERSLASAYLNGDAQKIEKVLQFVKGVRRVIDSARLRRIMSTRTLVTMCKLFAIGQDWESVEARYFVGWSESELSKVEGVRS